MAKSKKVMQVEHMGETMWLYDNGDIRNAKGHLKGKGVVPQSYTDGLRAIEGIPAEAILGTPIEAESATVAELPTPPPPPPEIKEPPMNDFEVVVNLGARTKDGFDVTYSKSMIVGSHNIKTITGNQRHKLRDALERVILQANEELRAIRDAPLVEKYKQWAEEDKAKADAKKELKETLKSL